MAKHAATTKVPVAQTRAEIDELLRSRECDGCRWTDHWKEGKTVLEFLWTADEAHPPLLCKFEISAGNLDEVDEAQEWRRVHRVLRVFLLGLFEAVDGGLITLEEAMLPWVVAKNGRTVGQKLLPKLQELSSGSAHALLEG